MEFRSVFYITYRKFFFMKKKISSANVQTIQAQLRNFLINKQDLYYRKNE